MDFRGIGDALEAMFRLAQVGLAALAVLALAAIVGVPLLLWWLWTHVSVTVH